MAALRRVLSYVRVLRGSACVLFRSRNPAVHKPGKWTNILYTRVASLTVGGGLCAIPFKQQQVELSHDSLIKRAASLATDSSSTFLSQVTLALIDAITEYSKVVHTLIAVQKRYLDSLGRLTVAEEDAIWQLIIGLRAEVNEKQEECKRFESTWVSAIRLCETAAEAAYTSGAEHACITVRTNIQLAESQVEDTRKLLVDADKKLAEARVMEVERMSNYAASLESNSEEEEVPEAYLRED